MADTLITIANFDDAIEANLAKIKLASENIDCFLAGENFVATYWLLSGAEGGIKLQVRQTDAARALEILKSKENIAEETKDKTSTDEAICSPCPKCHSENVEYEKYSKKMFFLTILVFRFPLPFLKESYKCKNCGFTWKRN